MQLTEKRAEFLHPEEVFRKEASLVRECEEMLRWSADVRALIDVVHAELAT